MSSDKPKILVVGCVSRDLLHLPSGQNVRTVGGAGLHTALAARAAGADVTILAPRPVRFDLPDLEPVAKLNWIGPECTDDSFPFLEIKHHGNDQATLIAAGWGAESLLMPDTLPGEIQSFDIVHIAALSSAQKQLQFLHAIRERSRCKVSAGTYARVAYGETEAVRDLFSRCDFVFMNDNESKAIFDANFPIQTKENQIICITKGRNGATIFADGKILELPGLKVNEVDPTGAGDTFAGTFLAQTAQTHSLEISAESAIERSALVITQPGPSAISSLLS